jgi:hypothetical protein
MSKALRCWDLPVTEVVERLGAELRPFRDERGRQLYDATLEIELLTGLSGVEQTAMAQEGMGLRHFSAADRGGRDIRFPAPAAW